MDHLMQFRSAITTLAILSLSAASTLSAQTQPRPLDLDLARLAPVSDSFTILVQGQPAGFQATSLKRDGDGWIYEAYAEMGAVIQQTTKVRFSSAVVMSSLDQSGQIQGEATNLQVRYSANAVSGNGVTPGPEGISPVKYADVALPAGTIDDNALVALLPYFKWAPGAVFHINVFGSGTGELEPGTLRVGGEEEVTVPMGTIRAYRVDYSGGKTPMTYWIEVASPHRLVKFAIVAAPVEFVRVR
jgi:hypothetical protein